MKKYLFVILVLTSVFVSETLKCSAQATKLNQYVIPRRFLLSRWHELDSNVKLDSANSPFKKYINSKIQELWDDRAGNEGVGFDLELTLDSTGKVCHVKFNNKTSALCEAQIMQVFYNMPKWNVIYNKKNSNSIKVNIELSTMLYLDATDYFYETGIKQFESGELKKAIKNFNYSIDHYPYYTDAFYNRAASYLKLQDTVNACNDWKRAAKLEDLECKELYIKNCKGK